MRLFYQNFLKAMLGVVLFGSVGVLLLGDSLAIANTATIATASTSWSAVVALAFLSGYVSSYQMFF